MFSLPVSHRHFGHDEEGLAGRKARSDDQGHYCFSHASVGCEEGPGLGQEDLKHPCYFGNLIVSQLVSDD